MQGGLGNQMFQYAAGRALAHKYQAQLWLDTSFFEEEQPHIKDITPRKFQLDLFNIEGKALAPHFKTQIYSHRLADQIRKRVSRKAVKLYQEPLFCYQRTFEGLKPPVYLDGYWQSEKYFADAAQIIRSAFTFNSELTANLEGLKKRLTANAVSVHVRCGDYVTSKSVSERHGHCPPAYYKKAMRLLDAQLPGPDYFIFSDNALWVKENLPELCERGELVGLNNNEADWVHMYLMSCCCHHIIANSTFSWWAAWLNNKPGKMVIAPIDWFKVPPPGFVLNDLLPGEWIAI